jgi:phosphotransferase system enzyme I (PtsP)
MSSSNILKVRKAICNIPMADAQKLLDEILPMDNPAVIRSWVERYFSKHQLQDLLRPASPKPSN